MAKRKKHAQPTGGVTRIKAACGHLVSYPAAFNPRTKRGKGYIVLQSCPCGYGHVIIIRKSGVDVLTTDNPLRAREMIHSLPFKEYMRIDEFGPLHFHRFDETDAGIVAQFIDEFSRIPPPKSKREIDDIKAIQAFYHALFN